MRVGLARSGLILLLLGLAPGTAGAGDVSRDSLVAGSNTFAFELYSKLAREPGNVFFSPISIHCAIAMAYAGSRHETADELARGMHYPLGPEALGSTYAALLADLRRPLAFPDAGKRSELTIANAFWGSPHMHIRPAFVAGLRSDYGGSVRWLDFRKREAACLAINTWVSDSTQGRIPQILSPEYVSDSTVAVITNAIYFHGFWRQPFDTSQTRPGPFQLATGSSAPVPMMRNVVTANYSESPDVQMLELPYADERLSMVLLLPKRPADLGALEDSLNALQLRRWIDQCGPRRIDVSVPRFTFSTQAHLVPALTSMGIRRAFDAAIADFSGVTPLPLVEISDVLHMAFVAMDEEGTEAAAATGVIVARGGRADPPVTFRADHPFVFLIRDSRTGAILFLGRVVDPRST